MDEEIEESADVGRVSADRREELTATFGRGGGLASYGERWGYRTGEAHVFGEHFVDGTLLDVGCGTGRTSFLLESSFARVDAFDLVGSMIALAAQRRAELSSHVNFFVADAARLPVADGAYDNVLFAYNGIEGLPTEALRRAALVEVRRVLRPGGRFVFSTKSAMNRSYLRSFHAKRWVRGLGLPLFPEVAGFGPGDVVIQEGDEHLRYHSSNPFRVRRLLHELGFRVRYFNSEVRLGKGLVAPSWRANFDRWDHFWACERLPG